MHSQFYRSLVTRDFALLDLNTYQDIPILNATDTPRRIEAGK